MANNESLDEQQKRQQGKKGWEALCCYVLQQNKCRRCDRAFTSFQQMKMRDDSGLLCAPKENRVVGRRGPATSAAVIL